MRCCSSCSSTTIRPMFGSFMRSGLSSRAPTLIQRKRRVRGRDPDAIVDTVTDDPHAARPPTHDRRSAARRLAATPGLGQRVAHELRPAPARAAGTARPAPAARTTTDVGHPIGVAHRPRRGRRATPPGGPCSIQASISTSANRAPPGQLERDRRGRIALGAGRDAHEPAADALDPIAARQLRGARARRARPRARARPSPTDGRRRCREPAPDDPPGERARQRERRATASSGVVFAPRARRAARRRRAAARPGGRAPRRDRDRRRARGAG